MANYKIDWEKRHPEGYLSSWTTRHMANVHHEEMKLQAYAGKTSIEVVHDEALAIGLAIRGAEMKRDYEGGE